MRSSYKENNYGNVFTALVFGKRPVVSVELGVLDGYSTIHIAKALKFNKRVYGVDGHLYCWDLWDTYEYKHGNKDEVQKKLDELELSPFVKLMSGDGFEASPFFKAGTVDFLHVDISNTGSILKKVMDFWSHRLKPYGIIAFEGGSEERDNIDWMVKYNKPSIREELKSNKTIQSDFHYLIMDDFPSLTILQKKGCFT